MYLLLVYTAAKYCNFYLMRQFETNRKARLRSKNRKFESLQMRMLENLDI